MYHRIIRLEDIISRREAMLQHEEVWTRDIGQHIKEESHQACNEGGGTKFILQPPFTGYTLIAGLSAEEKIDGVGLLRDADGIVVADLHFVNGNLNGPCKLFTKRGRIFFEGFIENGFRVAGREGEKGDFFFGFYKDGKRYHRLTPLTGKMKGFYNETDVHTGELLFIIQINEVYKKNGICYALRDGEVYQASIYENGEEKRILKELNGDTMKEYDDDKYLRYEGSYINKIKQGYPRTGKGKLFDDAGRVIIEGDIEGTTLDKYRGSSKGSYTEFYYREGTNGDYSEFEEGREIAFGYVINGARTNRFVAAHGRYYKESDMGGNIISMSQLNTIGHTRLRNDLCYIYEEGIIKKASIFEDGKEKRICKEFIGDIMKEYDDDKYLRYEGSYINDVEQGYPRTGKGILYDELGRVITEGDIEGTTLDKYRGSSKGSYTEFYYREGTNGDYSEFEEGREIAFGEIVNGCKATRYTHRHCCF